MRLHEKCFYWWASGRRLGSKVEAQKVGERRRNLILPDRFMVAPFPTQ